MKQNASTRHNAPVCPHCGQGMIQIESYIGKRLDWHCRHRHCNLIEAEAVVKISRLARGLEGRE